ncbi:hypothetical protein RD792_000897 [Penstemon davidsonii]|uniref:Uncharacterized protein n=1 Tax=Penstemon davidsonii TaxID=160366 RepID=A0ABR0DM67_9LAMI|nr:hypothetical protein RD792_000897 [Penstemon davidsonii]
MEKTIFLILLIITSIPISHQKPREWVAANFDYYKLVLMWPNTFCSINQCGIYSVPLEFTIHGYWPDNKTILLEFCGGRPGRPAFDYGKVKHTLWLDLKLHWPNLIDPTSISFLEHEWERHGLCDTPNPDQNSYFSGAMTWKRNLDVTGSLKDGGVTPDDYTTVKVAKIKEAIVEKAKSLGMNYTPDADAIYVKCIKKNSDAYLSEIVICLDAYDSKIVMCHLRINECQDENVYYLSSPQNLK